MFGAIYTRSDGSQFYLAWRKNGGLFRDGEVSDSAAFRTGKAIWALDYDTLLMLRARGISSCGILDFETGDMWMTTVWKFLNINYAPPRNYSSRGGSLQRFLPTYHFRRILGPVKV